MSINRTTIINRFNVKDAFVVHSQGQSEGLWLIWTHAVDIAIVEHNPHYILVVCNNTSTSDQFGLVYIYGDPHHRTTSTIWARVLHFVVNHSTLPILAMGDMNELMHPNEKAGSGRPNISHINMLCDYVKQCGLLDLGYNGPAYTWTNKRFNSSPNFQRLDRSLMNIAWCTKYPQTAVYHLPMVQGDHAPILTMMHSTRPKTNPLFRFENWWLLEQDFNEVAKQSWEKSSRRPFHLKTKYLAYDLKKWRKAKPNISTQLGTIEDLLLQQQSKPPHLQDFSTQKHLISQHEDILRKLEEFHIQRAKKQWAKLGDRNTAYFHQAITKRSRKNTIAYLYNTDGTEATSPNHLADTLLNYFHDIYGITSPSNSSNLQNPPDSPTASPLHQSQANMNHINNFQQTHNLQMQQPHNIQIDPSSSSPQDHMFQHSQHLYVTSTPTVQELHAIIKKMRSNASPGPDGLNAGFYKAVWEWISTDIHKLVSDFYSTAFLNQDITQTYITLIPKKMQPTVPQDFRPISLCNVIYRLIAKSLADRLKIYLPNYIHNAQYAFIQNRHISSNIIIT